MKKSKKNKPEISHIYINIQVAKDIANGRAGQCVYVTFVYMNACNVNAGDKPTEKPAFDMKGNWACYLHA